MDFRDRELKMDLVRVLTRQYHFLIFKKNFSRNTPPYPEANITNKSVVQVFAAAGPRTCVVARILLNSYHPVFFRPAN
jgi:hypothetical protein